MFTGFNLSISEDFFENRLNDYIEIQNNQYNHHIDEWDYDNYKYITDKNVDIDYLSGNKIITDWFPKVEADIFISHSHNDKNIADALGGWLKDKYDLSCFIDSNVWGYADHLLKHLNEKYAESRLIDDYGRVYDYDDCNHNSQHINIMLLMALEKMIDNVETVFFLNTNNSISKFKPDKTYSPWIYAELLCAKMIRKRKPNRYDSSVLSHTVNECKSIKKSCRIEYNAELKELIKLNAKDLLNWKNKYNILSECALDTLYSLRKQELEDVYGILLNEVLYE